MIPACDKRCHIGPVMTSHPYYAEVPVSWPHMSGAEMGQLEDGMYFELEEHFWLSI